MAEGIHERRYLAAIAALRAARRDKRLTQADMGQRLGQRQQFVSKYESGERRLDIIEFIDVATALGVDWVAVLTTVSRLSVGRADQRSPGE